MEKNKNNRVKAINEDSINSTVSSCDLTGLEPTLPKNREEAESYHELAGVPVGTEDVGRDAFSFLERKETKELYRASPDSL